MLAWFSIGDCVQSMCRWWQLYYLYPKEKDITRCFQLLWFYSCVGVYLCICVSVCDLQLATCRGQKRMSEPFELKIQAVMSCQPWVLGTELRSSVLVFVNDTNWMWQRGLKLLKTPRPVASTRYPWWLMAVQNQHYFLVKAFCHFSFSGAQWWAPLGTEKWPFLLKGFVIVKSPIGSFETETMNFWSMSVFPRKILLLNCFGS